MAARLSIKMNWGTVKCQNFICLLHIAGNQNMYAYKTQIRNSAFSSQLVMKHCISEGTRMCYIGTRKILAGYIEATDQMDLIKIKHLFNVLGVSIASCFNPKIQKSEPRATRSNSTRSLTHLVIHKRDITPESVNGSVYPGLNPKDSMVTLGASSKIHLFLDEHIPTGIRI